MTMMFTQPSASLRRVSILAIDKVFASTLMQAKDFFHLASLRYSKQLGLGLQPMFEIRLEPGRPARGQLQQCAVASRRRP